MNGLRAAHARALALAAAAVDAVRPDRLDLPTPCAGWPLGRLLAHMVGQNHGFADAARGLGADPARWADRPVGDDPAGAFAASAARLTAALATADRPFDLPEIRTGAAFPAGTAIGFHLLDTLVHGWDVAVSVGVRFPCPPDDAERLLAVAAAVPPARPPGGAFGPVRPAGPRTGPFDRALLLLGRDPAWRP